MKINVDEVAHATAPALAGKFRWVPTSRRWAERVEHYHGACWQPAHALGVAVCASQVWANGGHDDSALGSVGTLQSLARALKEALTPTAEVRAADQRALVADYDIWREGQADRRATDAVINKFLEPYPAHHVNMDDVWQAVSRQPRLLTQHGRGQWRYGDLLNALQEDPRVAAAAKAARDTLADRPADAEGNGGDHALRGIRWVRPAGAVHNWGLAASGLVWEAGGPCRVVSRARKALKAA